MLCLKCGRELVSGAGFCAFCGEPVPKTEPDDEQALVRPKNGRVLGGVAVGMAQCFGLSVGVMRFLWVFLSIGSLGFIAIFYVVLYFVIPEEGSERAKERK